MLLQCTLFFKIINFNDDLKKTKNNERLPVLPACRYLPRGGVAPSFLCKWALLVLASNEARLDAFSPILCASGGARATSEPPLSGPR